MRDNDYLPPVFLEQPFTDVFVGRNGHVVIRQQDSFGEEVTVLVTPENVAALIDRLRLIARDARSSEQ